MKDRIYLWATLNHLLMFIYISILLIDFGCIFFGNVIIFDEILLFNILGLEKVCEEKQINLFNWNI